MYILAYMQVGPIIPACTSPSICLANTARSENGMQSGSNWIGLCIDLMIQKLDLCRILSPTDLF